MMWWEGPTPWDDDPWERIERELEEIQRLADLLPDLDDLDPADLPSLYDEITDTNISEVISDYFEAAGRWAWDGGIPIWVPTHERTFDPDASARLLAEIYGCTVDRVPDVVNRHLKEIAP